MNKAEDAKLKPCPFCGATCKHEKVWEGGPPTKLCDYYSCSNPGCPASPMVCTEEDWNTRAKDQP